MVGIEWPLIITNACIITPFTSSPWPSGDGAASSWTAVGGGIGGAGWQVDGGVAATSLSSGR